MCSTLLYICRWFMPCVPPQLICFVKIKNHVRGRRLESGWGWFSAVTWSNDLVASGSGWRPCCALRRNSINQSPEISASISSQSQANMTRTNLQKRKREANNLTRFDNMLTSSERKGEDFYSNNWITRVINWSRDRNFLVVEFSQTN